MREINKCIGYLSGEVKRVTVFIIIIIIYI